MLPNGHFWYCKKKPSPAAQQIFSLFSTLFKIFTEVIINQFGCPVCKSKPCKNQWAKQEVIGKTKETKTLLCIAAVLHNQKVDPQALKKKKKGIWPWKQSGELFELMYRSHLCSCYLCKNPSLLLLYGWSHAHG